MTYGSIVNKILFEVYGDTTAEASVGENLRGSEGIIGNIQRQIQEEHDYWFMEDSDTITLVDGTTSYDLNLTNEFKKEITLRIIDQDGIFYAPLTKLFRGQPEGAEYIYQDTVDMPQFYYISWNATLQQITLYPTIDFTAPDTRTLDIRYYGYLDKLSDNTTTFNANSDRLSIEAPYLIIYKATAQLCQTLDYLDKMQLSEVRAAAELKKFKSKDWQIKDANIPRISYKGI